MIKCTKILNDGKETQTNNVLEDEYPLYQVYVDLMDRMKAENCHTFVVNFEEGMQVLFTISDKKKT
jgi:hypothetical protein